MNFHFKTIVSLLLAANIGSQAFASPNTNIKTKTSGKYDCVDTLRRLHWEHRSSFPSMKLKPVISLFLVIAAAAICGVACSAAHASNNRGDSPQKLHECVDECTQAISRNPKSAGHY